MEKIPNTHLQHRNILFKIFMRMEMEVLLVISNSSKLPKIGEMTGIIYFILVKQIRNRYLAPVSDQWLLLTRKP